MLYAFGYVVIGVFLAILWTRITKDSEPDMPLLLIFAWIIVLPFWLCVFLFRAILDDRRK